MHRIDSFLFLSALLVYSLTGVYASNRLDQIIQQVLSCLPAMEELFTLVLTQLFLEIQRSISLRDKAEKKHRKAKSDYRLLQQEYRSKIGALQNQLGEAQSWKHKLGSELENVKEELQESRRKAKCMEQVTGLMLSGFQSSVLLDLAPAWTDSLYMLYRC